MIFPETLRFRFQLGGRDHLLAHRIAFVRGKRVGVADEQQAATLLRPLSQDPAALDRLRRQLGHEATGGRELEDAELIALVATGLARGKVSLWALDATLSPKAQKVLDRFQQQMQKEMQMTARDLVNPNVETIEGQPYLKKIPPERVLDALQDMFMDLPLGDSSIGRELIDVLGATSVGRGRDLANLSPRELAGQVGDQAKDWIKDKIERTREDHPALFWGMASAALVAAGALTYSEGTDLLGKVGVKPEIKHSFFDGALTTGGSLTFGPELSDPELKADVRGKTKLAGGTLEGGGGATFAGEDFGHLEPTEYHADAMYRRGTTSVRGAAQFDGDGDIQRFTASGSHTWKNVGDLNTLTATGGYDKNFVTGSERITGGLRGAADTYNFSVRGAHDLSTGASSVIGDFGKDFEHGRVSAFVEQSFGGPNGSSTAAGILFSISF
ncbi:MAG: hypothetical protein JRI23_09035 [Deltaproteobacteria bacterium]|jgi:hypothetical protein|nr:hypothetical protein [Deltaproteobacteria bacterium]MBW2531782.1 hypothetical protein [Deltaproteobacteria bacterium]